MYPIAILHKHVLMYSSSGPDQLTIQVKYQVPQPSKYDHNYNFHMYLDNFHEQVIRHFCVEAWLFFPQLLPIEDLLAHLICAATQLPFPVRFSNIQAQKVGSDNLQDDKFLGQVL